MASISFKLFAVALFIPALYGCAALDSSVDSRVVTLNRSVDRSRNENILLNIVRASYSQPLNFTSLSKVSDDGSVSLSSGLPTITFGPHPASEPRNYAFTNSLDTRVATSFDLGILDSTDFYTGLMKPISIETIDLLRKQGYSRQLLFSLLIDSVRVEERGTGDTREFVNDPMIDYRDDKNCHELDFAQFERKCDNVGENAPNRCVNEYGPASAKLDSGKRCPFHVFQYLTWEALRAGASTETRQIYEKVGKDERRAITQGHVCFDPALAEVDGVQKRWTSRQKLSDLNICDGQWLRNTADDAARKREAEIARKTIPGSGQEFFKIYDSASKSPDKSYSFKGTFNTRSTFGVFRFLGNLLGKSWAPKVSPNPLKPEPMLSVVAGSGSSCFTETVYDDVFCVPKNNSDVTKQIFGILSQLIALNVKPSDLPFTPTVRVAP